MEHAGIAALLVAVAATGLATAATATGAATALGTAAVTMTSPAAHAELAERTTLTANAPRARAVAFRGRWTDADGVRRWHHLGTDRDAADGFALVWAPGACRTPCRRPYGTVWSAIKRRGPATPRRSSRRSCGPPRPR